MPIAISATEVKRKAMIDTTEHDAAISSLISEMQPPLEYSVDDRYRADTANAGLQATLKLGMLEIITGEFIEQLRRESGSTEQMSVAGVSVGASTLRGLDLVQQGATRLAPYLKAALPCLSDTASLNSRSDPETAFSINEEVW